MPAHPLRSGKSRMPTTRSRSTSQRMHTAVRHSTRTEHKTSTAAPVLSPPVPASPISPHVSGFDAVERASSKTILTAATKKSDNTIPASAVPEPVPDTGIQPTTLTVPPVPPTSTATSTRAPWSEEPAQSSTTLLPPSFASSLQAAAAAASPIVSNASSASPAISSVTTSPNLLHSNSTGLHQLSPAIITLIAVGAACLLVAFGIIVKIIDVKKHQRLRGRFTPSNPILQDSPMFGGKEHFSPTPTWTTYAQPADRFPPSFPSDKSINSEKDWGSQEQLVTPYILPSGSSHLRPPPRNMNPVARVLSRLSMLSIAPNSPVPQGDPSRIGVAVADPQQSGSVRVPGKTHRKPAARMSRLDGYDGTDAPYPDAQAKPHFDVYRKQDDDEDGPAPPKAVANRDRARTKSIYSGTSFAPTRVPDQSEYESSLPYSFPVPPPVPSVTAALGNNKGPSTTTSATGSGNDRPSVGSDMRSGQEQPTSQSANQALLASLNLPAPSLDTLKKPAPAHHASRPRLAPSVSAPRFGAGVGIGVGIAGGAGGNGNRNVPGSRLSRLSTLSLTSPTPVPPSPSATSIYPDDSLSVREVRRYPTSSRYTNQYNYSQYYAPTLREQEEYPAPVSDTRERRRSEVLSPNPATTLGNMMLAGGEYGPGGDAATTVYGYAADSAHQGSRVGVARSGSGSKKGQGRDRDREGTLNTNTKGTHLRGPNSNTSAKAALSASAPIPIPRVPSPPPTLPSLAQMALAREDPDYHSPTYSIYGMYEAARKSGMSGV